MPTLDRLTSPAFQDIDSLNKVGRLTPKLKQWYFQAPRPEVELYDLEKDPGEWHNLALDPAYKKVLMDYQKILGDWMNSTHDFLPSPRSSFPGDRYNDVYESLNAKKIQ